MNADDHALVVVVVDITHRSCRNHSTTICACSAAARDSPRRNSRTYSVSTAPHPSPVTNARSGSRVSTPCWHSSSSSALLAGACSPACTRTSGRFVDEEYPKIGTVHASEKPFTLTISSLDLPFVGIVDLVADVEGKRTVIDFKTASSTYEDHEVALSDQLTAYQLAEPSADQSAFIVLVKTKEPRIDWYLSQRTGEQLREYLEKLGLVAQQIQDRVFFKRPGQHCSYCDFLLVCLGDRKQIEAMLTTVG